jgi:hypothetical protein
LQGIRRNLAKARLEQTGEDQQKRQEPALRNPLPAGNFHSRERNKTAVLKPAHSGNHGPLAIEYAPMSEISSPAAA